MGNGSKRLLLLLVLTGFFVNASGPVEVRQTYRSQGEEDVPHELFPLFEMPFEQTEPLRSELGQSIREQHWLRLRQQILNDRGQRIGAEFRIPKKLMRRTEFWFDIYTRYGESHHVIHHIRYPWIVFKVVDTSFILTSGKGPLWLRRDRANKLAKQELNRVRSTLKSLSKRRSFKKLTPAERNIMEQLASLPGPRQAVLRMAAANVRSQLGQRDFFRRGLVNSTKYLNYMEEEFRQQNLPIELTRMPFVESSFNEAARSKVGASGIWQIMPRTGKAYMIVNDWIDERNSPLKATQIAGQLLKQYHRSLKSWPLAVTSYNHGIGNIQKAIRHAKSRDLPTIIERYHRGDFRFASSNFYTCFLAALFAEKYNELIFRKSEREPLLARESLFLRKPMRARALLERAKLDLNLLLKYNQDLVSAFKRNVVLPAGYELHVPAGHGNKLTFTAGRPRHDVNVFRFSN